LPDGVVVMVRLNSPGWSWYASSPSWSRSRSSAEHLAALSDKVPSLRITAKRIVELTPGEITWTWFMILFTHNHQQTGRVLTSTFASIPCCLNARPILPPSCYINSFRARSMTSSLATAYQSPFATERLFHAGVQPFCGLLLLTSAVSVYTTLSGVVLCR
jgi:hypothetical protein